MFNTKYLASFSEPGLHCLSPILTMARRILVERLNRQRWLIYFAVLVSKELFSNADLKLWKEWNTNCPNREEWVLPSNDKKRVHPKKECTGPVWESKRVNCGMCITWALSVSAKGLYITATVPLESYISCLVSHNHKIRLLRAWETLSKIYHTYAARSNYAYEVKPTEQWRNGWTTLDVNTHDPGMYCCIISC